MRGATAPKRFDVHERENLTRLKIRQLVKVEIRNDRPLGGTQQCYATDLSACRAASVTADINEWRSRMQRIIELVQPGRNTPYFRARAYAETSLTVRTVKVPECPRHGYSKIILAAAHKRHSVLPTY